MMVIKRELAVLLRVLASCLTAGFLLFFISALTGEDLLANHETISRADALQMEINHELEGGIVKRVQQLGEVPDREPYRRFYCVELAKEIHQLAHLTEKQRILFDNYNVRGFEDQLRRIMGLTKTSDQKSLLNELEVVKRELKNAANLIEKKRARLVRQRIAYIVFFLLLWFLGYFYFSRGLIARRHAWD